MKIIKVGLGERSHNIVIARGILNSAGRIIRGLNIGDDAFIITNRLIKNKYGARLNSSLKKSGISIRYRMVADSEKSKSINNVFSIIKDLSLYDRKKKVFIIALGGGVIGDIAGFVASVYKRGIPYVQVPTTLLAQIDSAIGGKTAVDLSEGKNLVGAFYQPRLILTDLATLDSLDGRQIKAGLSEAIKYAVIKDKALFLFLEKKHRGLLQLNKKETGFLVYECSKIKAGIIERDEKEKKGLRTILNFGHTIGHAIEAACGFKGYNHGEAVALGMLASAYISEKMGFIDNALRSRIKCLVKTVGLPVRIKGIAISKIIKAHYKDKKFLGRENRLVLIKGIAKPVIARNIKLSLITNALKELTY